MDKKTDTHSLRTQSVKSKRKITVEHYLAKIFESLPGRAYIKDKNGIYLLSNEQLAKDSGFFSSADMIGKTDYDLPSRDRADLLRQVDRQVMDSGEPLLLEEPGTHADGSPAVYRTRKIPLRDENNIIQGIFGLSDDITREKQAEAQKKELEEKINKAETERFKRLMKNIQGHFYWKDREGRYLDCNDAVAKAAGFQTAQDIIGKTDHDVLCKEEADILRATDSRIMNTGTPEILEEPGIRHDGSIGVFMTSKFPSYDVNGNIDSIMGFSTDITLQKQAEIAKADFISNMQHDLKTPFAGISAIAMMLHEMETDPVKKSLMDDLLKSCNQWETVHHQIIAVLSVKEPLVAKKEWVSISSELTKIREMLSATLRVKALDFFMDESA